VSYAWKHITTLGLYAHAAKIPYRNQSIAAICAQLPYQTKATVGNAYAKNLLSIIVTAVSPMQLLSILGFNA
jgi:hypothetical protein